MLQTYLSVPLVALDLIWVVSSASGGGFPLGGVLFTASHRFDVPPAPPTEEARLASIRESIQRINKTIAQLRDMTDDGGKAK